MCLGCSGHHRLSVIHQHTRTHLKSPSHGLGRFWVGDPQWLGLEPSEGALRCVLPTQKLQRWNLSLPPLSSSVLVFPPRRNGGQGGAASLLSPLQLHPLPRTLEAVQGPLHIG